MVNNVAADQSADPTAAQPDIVLSARGLVRHFPVRRGSMRPRRKQVVRAVDGVDVELRRGETLGIVGESGSGKSTLARLLTALDRPTSGRVFLKGQDLFALKPSELRAARRDIQIILQDPYSSLDPRMTAGELVAEPFHIHSDVVPRAGRRSAVRDLFDVVGLNPDHINRYPHQFSGGQRQRIGIARALALRPSVIICDEPVSALDVSVQAQVINLLERLQREFGLSYVFVGHDLSVVRHVSDHVAVMYLGRIVEFGTNSEIYETPSHPYTQALLSAISYPDPTLRGRSERIVLNGEIPSAVNPPSGCAFRTRCWKVEEICAVKVPQLEATAMSPHPAACHFAGQPDFPRPAPLGSTGRLMQ